MWIHGAFLIRQMSMFSRQSAMILFSVLFSLTTLTGVNGFTRSVQQALLNDARALHAADISVRSNFPISGITEEEIEKLEKEGVVRSARVFEFYTMARQPDESIPPVLAQVKVVDSGYPFYGRITLESGRPFSEVLIGDAAVVEPAVLERLDVRVGDRIQLGDAVLVIRDILLQEPDRPVSFFSLGPRIFVSSGQSEVMELIRPGGRVQYKRLLRVTDEQMLAIVEKQLSTVASDQPEQVETFRTARSQIRRYLNNLTFFLGMIGMFILVLSGLAIQSAVSAYIQDQEHTIAVISSLGADKRFILLHYLIMIGILAMVGTGLGIGLGWGLQSFFTYLIPGLILEPSGILHSPMFLLEAVGIGLVVVGCFAVTPLSGIRRVKPARIFQKEERRTRRSLTDYTGYGIAAAVIMLFVSLKLDDRRTVLQFAGGIAILITLAAGLSQAVLRSFNKLRKGPLELRLGIRSLYRPGNTSGAVITTLTVSFCVILAVMVIENNLNASFVTAYPEESPNLFLIDIQPDQQAALQEELGAEAGWYPIVRSRIQAVNGVPVDREREAGKKGDNLARSFNLTYRDHLLPDERIQHGPGLFDPDRKEIQVSILDTVTEIRPMGIGDRILFSIQGFPIEAVITSVRTRTSGGVQPFFYFVFPEAVLRDLPHTLFAATRVSPDDVAGFGRRISHRFPNVSVIDVTQTLARFGELFHRLSLAIRFLMLFSISAGLLLLINSIWSTRSARIRETVYYKISGAASPFLLRMILLENGFLGGVSAAIGLLMAQATAWAVCRHFLDIEYQPFWGRSALLMLWMVVLTAAVGLITSRSVIRHKPIDFLRDSI